MIFVVFVAFFVVVAVFVLLWFLLFVWFLCDNSNETNNFIINNSIDMTNGSAIVTNTTLQVTSYFILCFVLTIPNIITLETVIIHYDLLKIKLTSQVPPNNVASSVVLVYRRL